MNNYTRALALGAAKSDRKRRAQIRRSQERVPELDSRLVGVVMAALGTTGFAFNERRSLWRIDAKPAAWRLAMLGPRDGAPNTMSYTPVGLLRHP